MKKPRGIDAIRLVEGFNYYNVKPAEELKNYFPGKGCNCGAKDESECGCGVDWTPKEVYELRLRIKELETELRKRL